ncbi:hypothetical protein Syun_019761 [Stephania yunnanensis]|uniref:Uncharacterized protein n=1 Tax=Stephania yunnanensis TaxID=152371 RepID=A0AAP0IUS8_9MAGN
MCPGKSNQADVEERDEDFGANDLKLRSLMDQRGSSSDGSNLLQLMEFPLKLCGANFLGVPASSKPRGSYDKKV